VNGLPSLGPRGEGWVLLQLVLLGSIGIAGVAGPAWDGPGRIMGLVAGTVLAASGLALSVRGVVDLRTNLTALPHPRDDATLVEHGVYRRVRHPIYGGIILGAFGWGLLTASLPALSLALLTVVFFTLKSVREESWLLDRFDGYAAYRERTHRFIPGLW
jgi:protein-S-isoprenylcysteine O-methyltransferase Ste14